MSADGKQNPARSLDDLCPACNRPVGDHTLREWSQEGCLAGLDYYLPYEDDPAGPLMFPTVDGTVVGDVTIGPGWVDSPIGRMPILRFIFTGVGDKPMSRRSLRPIVLILDADGMKKFRQLVSASVDRAVIGARRGR